MNFDQWYESSAMPANLKRRQGGIVDDPTVSTVRPSDADRELMRVAWDSAIVAAKQSIKHDAKIFYVSRGGKRSKEGFAEKPSDILRCLNKLFSAVRFQSDYTEPRVNDDAGDAL